MPAPAYWLTLLLLTSGPPQGERFGVVGHLYPVIDDSARMEALFESLRQQQLDRLFVLGDSCAWRQPVVDRFRQQLPGVEVYFAPGNHDFFSLQRPQYLDQVGYLETWVEGDGCNYLVLNSCESAEHNRKFIEASLANAPSQPTLVFCHHPIWNDRWVDPHPYSTHKCFRYSQLQPLLEGRVTAIFSGNVNRVVKEGLSSHQVFGCESIGGVLGVTCGMAYDRVTFVVAEWHRGELALLPRVVEVAVSPRSVEAPDEGSDDGSLGPLERLGYLLRFKQFWAGVLFCGLVGGGAQFLRWGICRRR